MDKGRAASSTLTFYRKMLMINPKRSSSFQTGAAKFVPNVYIRDLIAPMLVQ